MTPHALTALRTGSGSGALAGSTEFAPGIALHADPALGLSGHWCSPTDRLLELEAEFAAPGAWIGLHVRLKTPDLSGVAFLGFACRSAARAEIMVRPCLRSAEEEGFTDHFFARHMLALPEPRTHVDALYLPVTPEVPAEAPWRELIFFLPREDFGWHLHDLRLFAT